MQAIQVALAALQQEVAENKRACDKLQLLKDAINTRGQHEADVDSKLALKDSEVARLHGEISRLRQAVVQATQLSSGATAEVQQLSGQLQQAQLAAKQAERSSILQAATPAADTPAGQIIALTAQLEQQVAANARLQSEMAARAAATQARDVDMQEGFARKIADMRRTQAEALSAVEARQAELVSAAGKAAKQECQAELSSLQQQLSASQQQVDSLTGQLGQAGAQLANLQQQLAALKVEHTSLQAAKAAVDEELKKVQADNTRLQQVKDSPPAVSQPQSDGNSGKADSRTAELQAMVGLMEQQVGRLSELLRLRDAEIVELKRVCQAGLEERRELVAQLNAALSNSAAAVGQTCASDTIRTAHSIGQLSPGSPTNSASSGRVIGHSNGSSPHKPYRTGLMSKPRFR